MPVTSLSRLAKTAHDPSRPVAEDDVLPAFYWQRLCVVRLARGMPADTVSKTSRAIDGRMALGIPVSYMGAHVYTAITRLPLGQAICSFATFIARQPDSSVLMYNDTHNGNTDVGATSSLNTNQTLPPSWGPSLGPCRFFRRSIGAPIPGAFVVQPAEGLAIPVAVCLPQDDLEALKKDSLWRQYTRCIG
ncbi:hypothetical protein DL770_004832 [Monosporascus sp. CRB-9-2]|nr:hypothetical protein DL770_004832 [Monosporascus sp. CRB-9-2]